MTRAEKDRGGGEYWRALQRVRAASFAFLNASILSASFLLGGCALTTGHVDVAYRATGAAAKIADAASPPVTVEVHDNRSTPSVGNKINGFGMKMADIVADNDIAATLKSAFEVELKDRGFVTAPAGNVVSVDLRSFQNQYTWGFFSGNATASLEMEVTVKRSNGTAAYNKFVTGQATQWIEIAGENNAQDTLNAAMQDGVAKVFSDTAFIDALKASGANPRPREISRLGKLDRTVARSTICPMPDN